MPQRKKSRGSDERKGSCHRDEEQSKQHKHQKRKKRDCTSEGTEGEEEWVEPNRTIKWEEIYREASFRL